MTELHDVTRWMSELAEYGTGYWTFTHDGPTGLNPAISMGDDHTWTGWSESLVVAGLDSSEIQRESTVGLVRPALMPSFTGTGR